MASLGLRQIVLTTRYEPSDALTIQDKEHLDRTIPAAVAAGLRVVLDVYPYPPREVEAGLASPAAFAAYVAAVATTFPEVKQFVVGNEPNQPAFWRPQFAADGSNASAPAFGPYLAAAYDALKAVNPAIERDRHRALAARERSTGREEQHLDVTRALHPRSGSLVPGERPVAGR